MSQILEGVPGEITFMFVDEFLDELIKLMPKRKECGENKENVNAGIDGTSNTTSEGAEPRGRIPDRTDGQEAERTTEAVAECARQGTG